MTIYTPATLLVVKINGFLFDQNSHFCCLQPTDRYNKKVCGSEVAYGLQNCSLLPQN